MHGQEARSNAAGRQGSEQQEQMGGHPAIRRPECIGLKTGRRKPLLSLAAQLKNCSKCRSQAGRNDRSRDQTQHICLPLLSGRAARAYLDLPCAAVRLLASKLEHTHVCTLKDVDVHVRVHVDVDASDVDVDASDVCAHQCA
eukprot:6190342-Pleurochrysis_carterae.AAC.3